MMKLLITYLGFVATRVFGTGVDTLVLFICSRYLFSGYWGEYVISPIISFEFAVLSNFLFSYCWIWKSRIKNKSIADFCGRFFVFNLSSLAGFGVKMVFLLIFQRLFMWDVIYCNFAALLISGLFNFFVADMLVFKPSKKKEVSSNETKFEVSND